MSHQFLISRSFHVYLWVVNRIQAAARAIDGKTDRLNPAQTALRRFVSLRARCPCCGVCVSTRASRVSGACIRIVQQIAIMMACAALSLRARPSWLSLSTEHMETFDRSCPCRRLCRVAKPPSDHHFPSIRPLTDPEYVFCCITGVYVTLTCEFRR